MGQHKHNPTAQAAKEGRLPLNDHQICERCREGTKRPTGFWDGKDEAGRDASGIMFSCDNPRCKIAAKRRRAAEEKERAREASDEANGGQGIAPEEFIAARRRAGITLYEAAKLADISPATLSAYENRRLPFPVLIYNRLMALFNQEPGEGRNCDRPILMPGGEWPNAIPPTQEWMP